MLCRVSGGVVISDVAGAGGQGQDGGDFQVAFRAGDGRAAEGASHNEVKPNMLKAVVGVVFPVGASNCVTSVVAL